MADDRALRRGLAAALVANALFAFFYYLQLGVLKLPLHLCDLAIFFMAAALISNNRMTGEIAFCWGLAGSSQAVLTPDLFAGFPSLSCTQFFFSHCAVMLSAVYLAVRGRVRLSVVSVWLVWILTNLYGIIVGVINWRFGLNFCYLAAKPAHPSILDHFGPWPYYLIGEEFLALGLFFLCFAFSRFVEFLAARPSSGIPDAPKRSGPDL